MLIARFHPYVGGTELQSLRLSQKLVETGNKVFVVTQRYSSELKSYEIINNVPVHRLSPSGHGFLSSLGFMLSSFLWLFKNRDLYHIIHVHLVSSPAITAAIIGKLLNKKIVIKFAGARKTGDIGTSIRKPFGRIKLFIVNRLADIFVCPSEEVKKEMVTWKFDEKKIRKIGNGVDTVHFVPTEDKVALKNKIRFSGHNKLLSVYIGRLEPGKGLEFLVASWKEISEKLGGMQLLIIGDGTIRKNLEQVVNEMGINNFIYFLGWQKDIKLYLSASDVFILPSLGEGLSNSLLEAMSCGIVPVVTRIDANQEVVKDGENGLLFTPNNFVEFSEIMINLSQNPGLVKKIGANARKTVEDRFSMNKIVSEYEQLYESLILEK